MTRNRAERRHHMVRLKKIRCRQCYRMIPGVFRKEFLVSRTVTNKIITMSKLRPVGSSTDRSVMDD